MTAWPGRLVLGALALIVALTVAGFAAYPGSLRTPYAWLLPPVIALVLAGYAVLGGAAARRPGRGQATGVCFGLAAGALWAVELWAGGPALLSRPAEVAVGATFSLAAVAASAAAGVTEVVRGGTPRDALRAGVMAGLVSGEFVFLFGVAMTLSTLDILGTRVDYQRQLAGSGAPDMTSFLVQDIFAAVTSHLVINLALGLAGAGLAALTWLGTHARLHNRSRSA
jgi:hypothetical protein